MAGYSICGAKKEINLAGSDSERLLINLFHNIAVSAGLRKENLLQGYRQLVLQHTPTSNFQTAPLLISLR